MYRDLRASTYRMPEGWTAYIHPQGWIYFRNDTYRVVTDEDPRDSETAEKLNAYCEGLKVPSKDEEVHVMSLSDPPFCMWLNHSQCVAGFHREDATETAVHELSNRSLQKNRRLYYTYIQQHPSHTLLPDRAYSETLDALTAIRLEYFITGSTADSPFSQSECEDLMRLLSSIKDNRDSPSTTALLAWILKDIYGYHLGDKHGALTRKKLNEARSLRNRPAVVHQPSKLAQSILSLVIRGPFFGIPQVYFAHTKHASEFRGRLADLRDAWDAYTRQLIKEFTDFVLAATVLLSATMGFLAIQDIEQAAKALGIISVFASLSSIIVGVFFIWRHHRPPPSKNTMAYIYNARNNPFGLHGHSILLSLPAVFLVWSIIAFGGAVLAYTVQNNQIDVASIWTVVVFFVLFVSLSLAAVYTFSKIWVWRRNDSLV